MNKIDIRFSRLDILMIAVMHTFAYIGFFLAAYCAFWTRNDAQALEHLIYFAVFSVMTIRMRVDATMNAIKRFNGEGI